MKPSFLLLLLLLLGCLSHLMSLDAVPLSRTIASRNKENELKRVEMDQVNLAETFVVASMKGEIIHGRMDIEQNDYAGSGPNTRHLPTTPPPKR